MTERKPGQHGPIDPERGYAATARLRQGYLAGKTIGDLVREEMTVGNPNPVDVMFRMMDAFGVGLANVSCIDGWWPPVREVTDENLDLWIREAIEAHRGEWDIAMRESR